MRRHLGSIKRMPYLTPPGRRHPGVVPARLVDISKPRPASAALTALAHRFTEMEVTAPQGDDLAVSRVIAGLGLKDS